MHLLPRYVILLRTVGLPRIEEQASLVLMIVGDCDLEVKHLLVRDHDLHHQVRLHQVQVLRVPRVRGELRLRRMLEEQNEALARLVVGFFYLAAERPTGERVLVYKRGLSVKWYFRC